MPLKINIPIGMRYERWTIIQEVDQPSANQRCFLCQCDCGNRSIVQITALRSGRSKSCGCLQRENLSKKKRKHGLSGQPIYDVWRSMIRRCYNKKHRHYRNWGGRGIKVCPEWHDPSAFIKWADLSGYKPILTIERKDNDGDYSPGNCKWATASEQANNRRNNRWITYKGQTLTVYQWARATKIPRATLYKRIMKGWSFEEVFKNRCATSLAITEN